MVAKLLLKLMSYLSERLYLLSRILYLSERQSERGVLSRSYLLSRILVLLNRDI